MNGDRTFGDDIAPHFIRDQEPEDALPVADLPPNERGRSVHVTLYEMPVEATVDRQGTLASAYRRGKGGARR